MTEDRNLKMLQFDLRHPGTDRRATVQRIQDYGNPISAVEDKYVLVIAADNLAALSIKAARAWVDAGASYICAWGRDSSEIEESFDYAAFLPECGAPLPFMLMTTSHTKNTLDESLWFAFYNAHAPDDLDVDNYTSPIVVIVDSDSLFQQCSVWITENTE